MIPLFEAVILSSNLSSAPKVIQFIYIQSYIRLRFSQEYGNEIKHGHPTNSLGQVVWRILSARFRRRSHMFHILCDSVAGRWGISTIKLTASSRCRISRKQNVLAIGPRPIIGWIFMCFHPCKNSLFTSFNLIEHSVEQA